MKKPRRGWLLALGIAVAILGGCSTGATETARFVRYMTLKDGTRAAIVESTVAGAYPPTQQVMVAIDDLRAGELVRVKEIGRSWDEPQYKPTAEILARVSDAGGK